MSDEQRIKIGTVKKSRSLRLNEYLDNARNKSIFVIAVSILFTIFFLVVGVIPAFQSVFDQSAENQKIEEAITKMQKRVDDIKVLIDQINSDANVLDYFNKVFPGQSDQEEIMKEMFELAEEKGVFINSVTFSENERAEPLVIQFGTVPQVISKQITVSFESNRVKALDFLKSIENSRKIFNVTDVTLSRKLGELLEKAGPDKEYDSTLVIEYFYWSDVIEVVE